MSRANGDAAARRFHIWACRRGDCRLRFPQEVHPQPPATCPRCGGPIDLVRTYAPARGAQRPPSAAGPRVELLVDNLRSALNVGSILRTADGAGVDHVHLCGITPTPRHPKVAKTALGAQETVPWTQRPNGLLAAEALRARGVTLIGLEAAAGARSLFDRSLFDRSLFDRSLFDGTPPDGPLALVVGSEITGIDPAILERCARVFFLPMLGVKESLNVAVALGIALYHLRFGMRVG